MNQAHWDFNGLGRKTSCWVRKNMATVVGISWECLGNLWNIISTVVEYHGIFWNMFDNTIFVLNMMEYGYGMEMEVYSGKRMYRMYTYTILPNMEKYEYVYMIIINYMCIHIYISPLYHIPYRPGWAKYTCLPLPPDFASTTMKNQHVQWLKHPQLCCFIDIYWHAFCQSATVINRTIVLLFKMAETFGSQHPAANLRYLWIRFLSYP